MRPAEAGVAESREVLPALLSEAEWGAGETFEQFVQGSSAAAARRMRRRYDRTPVEEGLRQRWRRFAAGGGRVYVLAEEWCGDCQAHLPVLARLADEGGVPLRVFRRDARPELRDRHLTGGKAKIPLAVAVRVRPDGGWEECGRFVERPAQCDAAVRHLPAPEARRALQEAYASGDCAAAAVAELDATLGDGPEPVSVPGSGGRPVRVYLHLPYGVTPSGAVVAAHGANHDASHPLSRNLCQRLAQRGVAAVRFDFAYRVEGSSFSQDLRAEEQDLDAVVEWVRGRLGLPCERLVLAGKSLGAAVAVRAAGRKGFAGVVAFGYPLHLPGRPPHEPFERFEALKAPLLWFAGRRDPLAEPAHVEAYAARVRAPLELQWLEGADHSLRTHLHPILDGAVEWIRARLG